MDDTRPSTAELAAALRGAAPTLDPDEQRVVVELYRMLSSGKPVSPVDLAGTVGLELERVNQALDRWPGVYRDDEGSVIGFWGLALSGMPHSLQTESGTITAWCALDPFLIAPLLGVDARVRSSDPVTGQEVSLSIGRNGLIEASPESAVISMVLPEGPFDHDVVQSFCHYVWFFASAESGKKWIAEHRGTFLMSVLEADAAARASWPRLLGQALEPQA